MKHTHAWEIVEQCFERPGIWYEVKIQKGTFQKSTFKRNREDAIQLRKEWDKAYGFK